MWYLRSIVQSKSKWKMSLPKRGYLLDFGEMRGRMIDGV